MANEGYYCSDKRIVLEEATDITVTNADGEEVRIWGDRWDHLDGVTLVIFRDDQVLHTYRQGEWKGVSSFGYRVEKTAEQEEAERQDDEG